MIFLFATSAIFISYSFHHFSKVRGAVGDADVIVLVSDVYGEPLADVKIMQK